MVYSTAVRCLLSTAKIYSSAGVNRERFLQNQNDLLGGTFDKRHVYAVCLNRRDIDAPYCHAAWVLELLISLNAIYYAFQIIFLTIELKTSKTYSIIFVLAGVSLVYPCVLCVFSFFLYFSIMRIHVLLICALSTIYIIILTGLSSRLNFDDWVKRVER